MSDDASMSKYFMIRVADTKLDAEVASIVDALNECRSPTQPPANYGWWKRRKWAKGASEGTQTTLANGTFMRVQILKLREKLGLIGGDFDELDKIEFDELTRRYTMASIKNSASDGITHASGMMQTGLDLAADTMDTWAENLGKKLDEVSDLRGAESVGYRETLLAYKGILREVAAEIREEDAS